MTAARTTSARRFFPFARRTAVALAVGAGVVLTPLPALASPAVPTATAAARVAAPNQVAQVAVDTALAQQGTPYVWAGAAPGGFDCSGLTQYAFQAAGIALPHSSRAQSTMGTPIALADLQPGDLVFFYSPVSHVGIYIGDGQMVHAPSSGDVVKVTDLAAMGSFSGASRLA
jgi:cell wall-associated NlpC family hydrolase